MEIFTIKLRIQRVGSNIQFCWVPAHVTVVGNEKAQGTAKRALKLKDSEIMKVPFGKSEARSLIRKTVRDSWQKKWDKDVKGRHYHNTQKSVKVKAFKGICRREEECFFKTRTWTYWITINLLFIGKLYMR